MRMAGDSSVMVVMPSNSTFRRPTRLSIPSLSITTTDTPTTDDLQATPDNAVSRRRRRSTDDGNTTDTTDEEGDTQKTKYTCRFCKMWFGKSQALGGHMNRHRQERETEQILHAQKLVQQHATPRGWNRLVAAESINGSPGAGPSGYSPQLATGAPSIWPDGSRPQIAPQMSVNSTRLPITTTSSPTMPDSSTSPHCFLPSNSSSNNLQWNADGFASTNAVTLPRSHQGPNPLDSMTGCVRDNFLPPLHDGGPYACQAPYTNATTTPMFNSRATGLGGAGPGLYQEQIQGARGIPIGPHDHQNMRISEMLRQLPGSSPISTLMQSSVNPNADHARLPLRTPVSSPTYLTRCNNTGQTLKQSQMPVLPRLLGNSTAGTPYNHIPLPTFPAHAINILSSEAPSYGGLPGTHDFNGPQEVFENNMHAGNMQQRQYAVTRAPTSSGSAASGSFGVSESHEPQGMTYKIINSAVTAALTQPIITTKSVVQEVVDGNRCESMNITTLSESCEVSVLSAPGRYHSTDFSSGSPDWRTQTNSPSGQANHNSSPSQDYCSG